MMVLGIDPGTARMGYGLLNSTGRAIKLVHADVIVTHPDLVMQKRLMNIYKALLEIAKEYSPDVMVIEKLFFNTNVKTAMTVGQARGISMLAAANKNLPVYEYTALEAKLVLTGYGRSSKTQVQDAIQELLKIPTKVKSDDASDALAMALCFIKKDGGDFAKIIAK